MLRRVFIVCIRCNSISHWVDHMITVHPDDYVIFVCSDVFMEKHWKSVIPKSICDYFFEAQRKVSTACSVFNSNNLYHKFHSCWTAALVVNLNGLLTVSACRISSKPVFYVLLNSCDDSLLHYTIVVALGLLNTQSVNGLLVGRFRYDQPTRHIIHTWLFSIYL